MDDDRLCRELGIEAMRQPLPRDSAARFAEVAARGVARLRRHGDIERYLGAIEAIGTPPTARKELDAPAPRVQLGGSSQKCLSKAIAALRPWKKGPFRIHTPDGELLLDAEWQSNRKWERVTRLFDDFADKHVLDVGTGNGYFLYRLLGAGARSVLGLEPGVLSACQFLLLQRVFRVDHCGLLPVTSEQFLRDAGCYDVVLSMGVLYHRRSPLDHLLELRSFLRRGGSLILETIAHPGPEGFSFLPQERYAQMRNVFFLPSPDTLSVWLKKAGFEVVARSPLEPTSVLEQRSTPFMEHPSLDSFLEPGSADPDDPLRRTVEGHVRPHRMIVIAKVQQ